MCGHGSCIPQWRRGHNPQLHMCDAIGWWRCVLNSELSLPSIFFSWRWHCSLIEIFTLVVGDDIHTGVVLCKTFAVSSMFIPCHFALLLRVVTPFHEFQFEGHHPLKRPALSVSCCMTEESAASHACYTFTCLFVAHRPECFTKPCHDYSMVVVCVTPIQMLYYWLSIAVSYLLWR